MTTPGPVPASGEVLALRRRYMAINDRCAQLEERPNPRRADPTFAVATERRAALAVMALTTDPETLGDVAGLMMLAFDKAQDLDTCEPTPSLLRETVPFILRAFALALPVVAKAAGMPLEVVADEYDQRRLAQYTAAMEAMPT